MRWQNHWQTCCGKIVLASVMVINIPKYIVGLFATKPASWVWRIIETVKLLLILIDVSSFF